MQFLENVLDGGRIEIAHQLADVLFLTRETATRLDPSGLSNSIEQGFWKGQAIEVGVVERDQSLAEGLRRKRYALA